ncbi:hypothetical protein HY572_00105 [Candidatus Micrarchaeota archaeon]|nr:hypothetical protein [Candidatus Micrarchaeota archaeon]
MKSELQGLRRLRERIKAHGEAVQVQTRYLRAAMELGEEREGLRQLGADIRTHTEEVRAFTKKLRDALGEKEG